MFEKDSPQDLLLRGFSREYILDKTGTDVGYHGSDNGAENLSDEDFAAWWSDVVKNCSYSNAKAFAVQTNQACREVFADVLEAQGWEFKEELVFDNNQKSHFHRVAGMTKREYESMLVFVR